MRRMDMDGVTHVLIGAVAASGAALGLLAAATAIPHLVEQRGR